MTKSSNLIRNDINDIDVNRLTLNFNDIDVERQFKKEYFIKSILGFRISFVILILIYSSFGLLDYFTSADYYKEFFVVRFLIVIPALFAVFLFSFHKNFIRVWQKLVSLCFLIGGVGIIYMLHKNPENIFYYGGMFLIFIGGYFFVKLHFYWAVIPGILLVVIYNISAFYFSSFYNLHSEYLIATNAFYVSANIIAMFALYNIEFLERKDFRQRFLLIEKKEEIFLINKNLESQVLDRTKLINKRNKKLTDEIDSRKEIEKKLFLAKEKAEESDLLKSAFLSNMSHEIRTPMNGILGFIDLLQDPEISSNEQKQYFTFVRQSGNRLLDTINDIIEISKIESNQTPLNHSEANIDEIMVFNYEFFKPKAESKNLNFSFINDLNNTFIQTDRNKLESVLTNLMKNALKFTKSGSVEFGCKQKDNLLLFYVKDTGVGINKDRINSIFNRFEQGDLGINRGYEGSGLGLSIAKAYSEMLGGNLWVESVKDFGSTFYFTISYNPVQKQAKIEKAESLLAFESETEKVILVAEDDEVSFSLVEIMLSGKNFKLIHAKNGKEALRIFNEISEIALILMDLKMPEMDGFEATKQIRKLNINIPIIAQSAYALVGDKETAIKVGCSDYITKPINRIDLLNKIQKNFEKEINKSLSVN